METMHNKKFYELLQDYETAMLITHHQEQLSARPMAIAYLEDNCKIWFLTSDATLKVDEIVSDPHVHITCQKDQTSYLSLSGTATIVRDKTKIAELWQEPFRVWFPEGKDDPHLALISVNPERGEYWDNEGINKVKYLYEAVKAYATGTTPTIEQGEQHGTVSF